MTGGTPPSSASAVAEQLREKMHGLTHQEKRINNLSSECGSLRLKVAELVRTSLQAQEEYEMLCTQVKGACESECVTRRPPLVSAAIQAALQGREG